MSFLQQLIKDAADFKDVIEDHTISDQMVVLDKLPLLLPIVGGDDAIPTKR